MINLHWWSFLGFMLGAVAFGYAGGRGELERFHRARLYGWRVMLRGRGLVLLDMSSSEIEHTIEYMGGVARFDLQEFQGPFELGFYAHWRFPHWPRRPEPKRG